MLKELKLNFFLYPKFSLLVFVDRALGQFVEIKLLIYSHLGCLVSVCRNQITLSLLGRILLERIFYGSKLALRIKKLIWLWVRATKLGPVLSRVCSGNLFISE